MVGLASAFAAEQSPGVEGVDGRSRETLDHLEDILNLAAEFPDEDEGDPVGEVLDGNLYAELHQGCQRTARLTSSLMICWMSGFVHVLPHQPAAVAEGAPRTPSLFVRRPAANSSGRPVARRRRQLMASARPPRLAASPAPLIPWAGGVVAVAVAPSDPPSGRWMSISEQLLIAISRAAEIAADCAGWTEAAR